MTLTGTKVNRRNWLRGALAVAGAVALSGGIGGRQASPALAAPAQQGMTATLRLNWQITGPHVAYYLGKERGFWTEQGLDLEILEGNGSITTAQLVSNKSDTFGLVDASAIIPPITKGLDIVCVGMVSPVSSLGVIARADSGVTTLKDLEGKILAVTPGDSLTQVWPAVVAANGLDASKIRLVNVDAAAKIPAVLEKRADALLGSVADQNFTIQAQGVPTVDMPFSDYGVQQLNLGVFAHKSTVADNPDLVRAFVAGLQPSLAAAEADLDAGIEAVLRAKPELDPSVARNQASVWVTSIHSKNCTTSPLGYNCPEDWQQTYDLMVQYRELQTSMTPEDFYTNAFVPGV
ncbi:MAG: ABC transporter substrate-binding protein [Chloroflexi bacterium]|nr:ABC transporter substrate-binding protein [Chloroflexota bacterium]